MKTHATDLAGQVVLVTGGTRGLGLHISLCAAASGATVLVGAKNDRKGRTVADALRRQGRNARGFPLDLNAVDSIERAPRRIARFCGRLDILIHNAAVFFRREDRSLLNFDRAAADELAAVNAIAPAHLTSVLLPMLRAAPEPQIVFLCSDDSSLANAGASHVGYAMSKAALNVVMLGFARQLRDEDFRIFGYDPGWMRTDMGGAGAPGDPKSEAAALIRLLRRRSRRLTGNVMRGNAVAPWWHNALGA